jgi:hypothetical protein
MYNISPLLHPQITIYGLMHKAMYLALSRRITTMRQGGK